MTQYCGRRFFTCFDANQVALPQLRCEFSGHVYRALHWLTIPVLVYWLKSHLKRLLIYVHIIICI